NRGIPGSDLAAMSSGPGVHPDVRADEGRSLDVIGLEALEILAEIVVRDVEKPGPWRERRGLPVLAAGRRRADVADDASDLRFLLRDLFRPARLQVHSGSRGDVD